MKAVVLETRGREAAVLAMDGGVYIANGKYHVGETIDYREAKRPSARQWVAAVAAMVVLLGASAGLWVDRNYVAYAEVSLDVNPSIVYTVNRRDRVLGVRTVNEDAKDIVESLEQDGIRFATLTDAVDRTMALLEDEGYLNEEQEDYVLVNVSADDGNRQTRLTGEVEADMSKTMERDATLEYRIDTSDRATAKDARDNGMSTGRYAAWKQEEEKPDDAHPDMEGYSDMPVREIMGGSAADGDRSMPENEGAESMPPCRKTAQSLRAKEERIDRKLFCRRIRNRARRIPRQTVTKHRRKARKGRLRRSKRIRSPKLKSHLRQSPSTAKATGTCQMINASPMKAPLRRMTGLTHKRPHKQALRMTAGTLGKALVSSPIKRRAIRIEAVGRLQPGR